MPGTPPEVALVTGGAGDIGLQIVRRLAATGQRVLLADRVGAEEAAAGLRAEGLDVLGAVLDVTSPPQWDDVARDLEHAHDGIDVLVTAAGVEGPTRSLWDQSPGSFETVMSVNATGTFLALRAALPLMRRRGGGAVVTVSSTAGLLGLPGMAPYVASKHAVVGLTRAAAVEAARWGIRVNAVCPGPTTGRMISSIEAGARPDDATRARALYEAAIPLKRYATPSEVADVVAYLTSPAASYLTGAIVPVDGGMSAV